MSVSQADNIVSGVDLGSTELNLCRNKRQKKQQKRRNRYVNRKENKNSGGH